MILNNCELYYPQLDPKRPSSKFDKANPVWSVKVRTTDKAQKKAWADAGLKVNARVPEDDTPPYFEISLRKKSKKHDGEPAEPPKVIDGRHRPVDPKIIGNGSVGNIRVYMREYTDGDGVAKVAPVLMAVQITKLIVYKPKEVDREDFEDAETEIIDNTGGDGSEMVDDDDVAF